MCLTCGCSKVAGVMLTDPLTGDTRVISKEQGEHVEGHTHAHGDAYRPVKRKTQGAGPGMAPALGAVAAAHGITIELEQQILAKNQSLAERNRRWLAGRRILALNLVSSPGSGKTTLLERTIRELRGRTEISVVEGDQETANDAERIRATGCRAVQINTGTGCHLEAEMIAAALATLDPAAGSTVMIENVGNLVCPALFDLGECAKVVILSVTEGEDKPLKYPHMFRAAALMVINKIDLLPYVDFDLDRSIANAREVNPEIQVVCVSARSGAGMDAWYRWLQSACATFAQKLAPAVAV